MTTAVVSHSSALSALIETVAPRHFLRDPFGIFSGYRAYLVYTHLSAKSDAELNTLGIRRQDLPSLSMEVVFEGRRAR